MLTARYNFPIENISYEYIERLKCSRDTERELEKIIKILESGELGHYPDLLNRARDKLTQMNPKHKLAREKPSVVNRLDGLDPDLAESIKDELNDWCKEIKSKEIEAMDTQESQRKALPQEEPPSSSVRGNVVNATPTTINSNKSTTNINSSKARIKSCDYEAWDKFDPDVEIKKMDVAVEREKVRLKRSEVEKGNKMATEDETRYYTTEEKISRANMLRVKGNESYKAGKNQEAIDLYTQSLQLHSTPLTLGNRAQVYIKLRQFSKALEDTEEALCIDPNFVKGIYRKALALYNMKRYEEASEWFERVLLKEPNNVTVHEYMTKLHNIVPVKLRLDGNKGLVDTQTPKIVLLDDNEVNGNLQGTTNIKRAVRRNEWGLTKQPCVCTDKPGFIKQYEQNSTQRGKKFKTNTVYKGITDKGCLSQHSDKVNKAYLNQHSDKVSSSQIHKSSTENKRKYNEFLNPSEDFKPKSIINIFGTERPSSSQKGSNLLLSEKLEIAPKSEKENATRKPKIEIIDSVDFEE